MNNRVLGIIVVLVAIASFLGGASFNQWQNQKTGQRQTEVTASPTPEPTQTQEVLGELTSTIGNFSVLEEEVCQEEDKPIIYFFGSQSCPHCTWEHPVFESVVEKFENLVSFHNNMDDFETDQEVFQKYYQINGGGIPFMVLGCQYARVGSGENSGEETEAANLTALICKLTDGQPEAVCGEVENLIKQIAD
jgi:thiol-disulfide isomerase/thioredoxin